ncbi:16S rRNA (cytidine(1402)-2'-O)-methyltransferase [Myxococcota bacterium]|jgi:16S rRNA (cytidine1402-2'-O)-methyltransferase|nr:16S rRNA (cytidine(1402)-2'-O)-methyltransferase [Myxococcota bacterium]MBU1411582.1 16S rRNA (cytidine(1402)-2'-O)-methyltransferase [Myxococcota bacterium]MBU1509094.1 16S rRNA (cytidine(1402)-2'-O)-methyltransferase [Myxococcota bacterium]PKN28056.1 MAG: 16S rRNA (cytidine(1402)-2'-O)-methyltransferase [Deltaproteobacteria bacterium HGW-Deltaproteobacteria-22]
MKFVHEPHPEGVLYVVATPLGNLDDLSPRARAVLECVDLIAAEDTRVARHLLQALGLPKVPVISSFEGNEARRAEEIARRLSEGAAVALVTDAGTPCISDPGDRTVAAAREAGAHVIPIPGPSAVTCALSVSGFPGSRFHFEGFLPVKGRDRNKRLTEISTLDVTVVLYESPHRIRETLHDLALILGNDRECVLCREITKKFETITRGTLGDLDANSSESEIRGEFTLVLGPGRRTGEKPEFPALENEITRLRSLDLPVKTVATILAPYAGMSKSEVYEIILKFEKEHP